jgi:tetratricopeptide (TPR) repeat protein
MASKREALIASAEKALQKGKADSALKDYLRVLEETPGDINILNKVGDLFVRLNKNDESIPYYAKIADHYSRDGFFLKAIAIYKKINRLDPARLDIYERLAELYARQGLLTEAKSQYQVLADYHAKNENVIGAIGIYQKMVGTEPSNIQLHVKLADLFMQARRTVDALKEYVAVAVLLRDRGAVDEAVQVFEKALRIAPDNVEILRSLVPMLMGASRTAEASTYVKKALETTPRSVPLFLLAAEAAFIAGDLDEAHKYATKAQAVEPENDDVLTAVLRVQMKSGKLELALPAASMLAEHALRRGEAKKALGLLTPIADASLHNEEVLLRVIHVADSAGESAATLKYRSALAELWRSQGKVSEAAEALRACMKMAPDVVEYRARLAQLEPSRPAEPPPAPEPEHRPTSAPDLPGTPVPASVAPLPEAPEEMDFSPSPAPAAPQTVLPGPAPSREPSRPPKLVAPPRSDEFILDFDDEQLIHDPGSTGPVPSPIRRLSAEALAFAPRPPAPKIPPPPAFDALAQLDKVEDSHASASLPPEDVEVVEELEEAAEIPAEESGISFDVEVEAAVEEVQETAPPAAASARPPLQPAPVPARASAADIDSAMAESEVFRRYGLFEKAIEQLGGLLSRAPDALAPREKLFELYLESGKKAAAVAEAEILKDYYRSEGREDRVRAIDGLLVERTSAEMGEAVEEGAAAAFVDTSPAAPRERPRTAAVPSGRGAAAPTAEQLSEVDFCLDQGMVVDASERLQALESRFPGHPTLQQRRQRLEGSRGGGEEARPPLADIPAEDFESVLDAELGRALSDEMARGTSGKIPGGPTQPLAAPPAVDESALFSDEAEFFNFAGELQSEMNQEAGGAGGQLELEIRGEVSLEEIFREFKKGVEQQLSPEDYETHYNLGIAYKEMSLTDEAIGEFQKAAKDPLHAVECCSMLGLCFLEKGLPQLAIKWYKKGLEAPGIREDDRLGLQYDLANVFANVGERDAAYRTFLDIYGSNASYRDVGDRIKDLAPA